MSAPPASLPASFDGPESSAPAVIEVRGLSRAYARGRIRAVRDVSLRLARGEVCGLIGPDGAGKTSVLQVLAGVLRADAGAARVAGVDVIRDPEAVKALIGYMPQGLGLNLYDSLTVAENIEFFRDLRRVPREPYRENRERLLRMTRLEPFLDRPAGKLSGGMRQKLALICTLIHLPDVLLLDEPTTGVDPLSRRDFWSIIHGLVASRGVTVLLTTAYMDEAERCHHVSLMHDGAVIAAGSPEELRGCLTGRVYAVQSAHPDDVLDALKTVPAAQSATIAGAEVRVLVRGDGHDLTERLAAAGLAAVTLQPVRPSLEDVFIHHLTRDRAVSVQDDVPRPFISAASESGIHSARGQCRPGPLGGVGIVEPGAPSAVYGAGPSSDRARGPAPTKPPSVGPDLGGGSRV